MNGGIILNEIIRLIDSYMVKIPAGEIVLRDDRIKREWKAQIKPFLLAQYTVTMELYYTVINESSNSFLGNHKPVVNISWNDVIIFVIYFQKKRD